MTSTIKKSLSSFLAVCMIFGLFFVLDQPITANAAEALSNVSTISTMSVQKGQSVQVNAMAKGGTGFYQYAAYSKLSSATAWTTEQGYGANSIIMVAFDSTGSYDVRVAVKDSNGEVATKDFVVSVGSSSLANNSTLSATSVALGDSVKVNAKASGGTAPYLYGVYYKKTSSDKWSTAQAYKSNATVSFKPGAATTYDVKVKVKDGAGKIVAKSFKVTVTKALSNTSSVSSELISLGQNVTVTCGATGGKTPYLFGVYYKLTTVENFSTLQAYNSNKTVTFTPKKTGTYDIKTKVKDAAGKIVSQSFKLSVTGTSALTNTSSFSASKITLGNPVTIKASATGGSAPYQYAVYYRSAEVTTWKTVQSYKENSTIKYKPTLAGDYEFCVKVKDSKGTIVKKYYTVTAITDIVNNSSLSAASISTNDTLTISCSATGGTGYYQYAVYQKKTSETEYITVREYSSATSYTLTFSETGDYDLCVKAKDSNGAIVKKYFKLTVTGGHSGTKYDIVYYVDLNDSYLQKLNIENPNDNFYYSGESKELQDLIVEGYKFDGWFTKQSGGTLVETIPAGTTGKKTLYAHWTKEQYTVTFDSPLVPYNDTNTLTRYISDTTSLRDLEWMGYVFMGWSDDNGNIIKEIKPGTTDIKVHANWTSNRNQTIPNDYLNNGSIVIDNSENGQYLFVYDIGTIVNVPLYTIRNFGNAVGMSVSESYTTSVTLGEEQAKSVNETVANATTRSTSWTLSNDWNELVTEVEGQDRTLTDESTISISNGSSQVYTQSYDESIGTSRSVARKDGMSSKKIESSSSTLSTDVSYEETHSKTEYSIFEGIGVKFSIPVKLLALEFGLDVNGKWGSEETNSDTTAVSIGESSSESETNEKELFTEANIEESRSWNTSKGVSQSASVSQDKTVSNTVAESITDKFEYSISKSIGGSESTSTSDTTTNTEEKGYSSTLAYNTERNETKVSAWSNEGAPAGWYRLVCAGKIHVFAVVCYDIASSNYCTYTYSILDDDVYDFYDYSKNDKDFNDYNNGVLPFEVPVSVNEYVNMAISRTNGLKIDPPTGMITGYDGNAENVWIPDNWVSDNGDGTYDIIQVKGIKANAFQGNSKIKAVRLSSYITNIPDNAFKNCTSLKHIYSDNLETIGSNAFANCTSLTDVEHDNLKSIGQKAFDGCIQLKDFRIGSSVNTVGYNAFNGLNDVTIEAGKASVVSSIAQCGAKSLTIDLGKMADELKDVTITTNITDTFTFNGKAKTLKNVSIESSAKTTVLNRMTFTDNQKTPLRINSENVTLNQVNVGNTSGLMMILESNNTKIYLKGISTFTTTGKNAILCKKINVDIVPGTNETTKLSVPQGDILVCGETVYSSLINGSIRTISEEDYNNMLSSHTVYFDANGGNTTLTSKTVAYNSAYGTLPSAQRDYYDFAGWYTAASGGTRIYDSTVFTGSSDITLYAHWTEKPLSGWVDVNSVPSGAMIVNNKWTYDLITRKTSSSDYMSGYTLYDTSWVWSDYGAWSGWQNDVVYASESRDVATQYIQPTYKTQYNYNRWKSNSGYNWGPCAGTWSGVYCGNYEERGWSDSPLPFVITRYSGQVGGNYNTYGDDGANAWYNEWTREVQTGGGYTQYRYRDRYKIYTYYFQKVESKESSSQVTASDTVTNVKRWVRYRAK